MEKDASIRTVSSDKKMVSLHYPRRSQAQATGFVIATLLLMVLTVPFVFSQNETVGNETDENIGVEVNVTEQNDTTLETPDLNITINSTDEPENASGNDTINETLTINETTPQNQTPILNESETLHTNQSLINESSKLPSPNESESLNETEETDVAIESFSDQLPITTILSKELFFTKAADNRSLVIENDVQVMFTINSSSKMHYVGDVTESKEWAYTLAGVETITSDEELVVIQDHVCKKNNYVLQNAGTLYETRTYTSCIYYPPQIKNVEAESYVDDTGEIVFLPKDSTLPINVRSIEQVSPTQVQVTFEDDYDPAIQELTTGLISYWELEDNSDSEGSNNINNTVSSSDTGKLGNAYDYDGNDDFSDIPDDATLDLSSSISISFWFNSDNQKHGYIVAKYGSYMCQMSNTSGNVQCGFWISSNWNPWVESGNTAASTWHHLVFTYDKDAGGVEQVKLYLNGAEVDTAELATTWDTTDNPLYFGNRNTDLARDFDGVLDEVGIWNIALNASQVTVLYNGGNGLEHPFEEAVAAGNINFTYPTPSSGENVSTAAINVSTNQTTNHSVHLDWDNTLLLWWNFEYVSGSDILDNSTYGNDGDIINGATIESATRGDGMSVDGVNQYARIEHDEAFDELPLTLEAWIRFDSMPSTKSETAYFMQKKHTASPWRSWALSVGTDDKVRFLIANSSSGSPSIYSDNTLSVNNWYHVVATIAEDCSTNLFINGIEQAESGNCGDLYDSQGEIRVGADWSGGGRMNGTLDEVKIHNRLLTEQEIQASYNALTYPLYTEFTDDGSHNVTAHLITDTGSTSKTEERNIEIGNGLTLYLDYSKYIAACFLMKNGTLCLNSSGWYSP